MNLDINYFRTVQGTLNIHDEPTYKAVNAQDMLLEEFQDSINYVVDAKRNDVLQPMIITGTEVNDKPQRIEICVKNNPLNCWKPPKLAAPQRNHEIRVSVKATKVEKSCEIAQGQSLNAVTTGNQQPSSEQEKVQRLSVRSRMQVFGIRSGGHPAQRVKI